MENGTGISGQTMFHVKQGWPSSVSREAELVGGWVRTTLRLHGGASLGHATQNQNHTAAHRMCREDRGSVCHPNPERERRARGCGCQFIDCPRE